MTANTLVFAVLLVGILLLVGLTPHSRPTVGMPGAEPYYILVRGKTPIRALLKKARKSSLSWEDEGNLKITWYEDHGTFVLKFWSVNPLTYLGKLKMKNPQFVTFSRMIISSKRANMEREQNA